jgi:XTP/dITP diphosphohydrolase
MDSVVFVTTNRGKMGEAVAIGKQYGIGFTQDDYDAAEIQSNDLEEIAAECATESYAHIKKPLIVEDSGVFVEALGGFPGPYSAYVIKTIGIEGILKLMGGIGNRRAVMRSALVFADGKRLKTFAGEVRGVIADNRRGAGGFGYDPIFIPEDWKKTFSEDTDYKLRVSHRAQSIRKFCEWYAKR